MKIQHYSRLYVAESEEQYRARVLGIFQTRVDKRRAKGETVVFDPDVVNNDIDRWFYQRKQGNTAVKPQLEAYKTHEELHEAMLNFKSKLELEYDKKTGDFEHEGKELVLSFGVYKVFKTKDVKALTLLAQESNWCVQYPKAAEDYLIKKKSTFYIVLRGTERYVAIRETEENKPNVEVWWYTDYELRNGTEHAEFSADLLEDDLTTINQILQKLGFNSLSASGNGAFEVYPSIEVYFKTLRKSEEIRRFMYNQRFYPELAKSFFTPGTVIQSGVYLSGLPVESIPEGIKFLGGLYLTKTKITELPDDLYVQGNLSVAKTNIQKLPKKLKIGGSLSIEHTPHLKELPIGLHVGGSLSLEDTQIRQLPEGLYVGENLKLTNCPIETLPENLYVGKYLYLLGTNITYLPKNLYVGKNIYGTNPKTGREYQDEYREQRGKK